MRWTERYRRLSTWNRVGFLGSVASIVGLAFAVYAWIFQESPVVATVSQASEQAESSLVVLGQDYLSISPSDLVAKSEGLTSAQWKTICESQYSGKRYRVKVVVSDVWIHDPHTDGATERCVVVATPSLEVGIRGTILRFSMQAKQSDLAKQLTVGQLLTMDGRVEEIDRVSISLDDSVIVDL